MSIFVFPCQPHRFYNIWTPTIREPHFFKPEQFRKWMNVQTIQGDPQWRMIWGIWMQVVDFWTRKFHEPIMIGQPSIQSLPQWVPISKMLSPCELVSHIPEVKKSALIYDIPEKLHMSLASVITSQFFWVSYDSIKISSAQPRKVMFIIE